MTRIGRTLLTFSVAAGFAASLLVTQSTLAQPPGGAGKGGAKGGPAATAKARAPIDLTGYWVSLVTEDWVYRMVTPGKDAKGAPDLSSVPVTAAARAAAAAWDPAKDETAGQTCKAYGAAGLMRVPGRLNIDWSDDNTLRIQTDAGTQTRLMKFTGDASGAPSLQGFSQATWDGIAGAGRGQFGIPAGVTGDPNAPGGRAAPQVIRPGSMKVVTTNLSGGYLRKNGLPYSATTQLTEYYDVVHQPNGDQYLIVTTVVIDPINLTQPFRTSTHFKREANGAKFKPTPCSAR
jgi:hypothetical protein